MKNNFKSLSIVSTWFWKARRIVNVEGRVVVVEKWKMSRIP